MNTKRKYNQWSANSPLCRVPDHLRSRCPKAGCLGAADCPIWRQCGPATPFGGYGSFLAPMPTSAGTKEAPCMPA